jgi:predicted SprT family Zn-dependent metalloprotease
VAPCPRVPVSPCLLVSPLHPHDARNLAWQLMQQHGLSAQGWRFQFDHARRRFGACRYGRKLITLSRPLVLLNPEAEVRDTILHEIAHALCPGDGHGVRWKQKCREIGARPARCYREESVAAPPRAAARYEYGCGACGWWVERRRVTVNRYVCARCRGGLVYRDRVSGQLFRTVARAAPTGG